MTDQATCRHVAHTIQPGNVRRCESCGMTTQLTQAQVAEYRRAFREPEEFVPEPDDRDDW
jgi:hypothetical protein